MFFKNNGIDWAKQVEMKLNKARNLSHSVNSSDQRLNLRARVTIYRFFIRPLFEYGIHLISKSENHKLLLRIDSFQAECLSRLCGIYSRNVNRSRLFTILDIDSIFFRIEYLKYLYFHSIKFKDDNMMIKEIMANCQGFFSKTYSLYEIYDPVYNEKKERIVGPKLLRKIKLQRFNQRIHDDTKVLDIIEPAIRLKKFSFIFDFDFKQQKRILNFLMRRFMHNSSDNFTMKMCTICNCKVDIEHLVEHHNENFKNTCHKLLCYEDKSEISDILEFIRQIIWSVTYFKRKR
jgi:hypothetical protein